MEQERVAGPKPGWLTNGCLAIAAGCLAAIALCALTTVITHLLVNDSTAARELIPVTEIGTIHGQIQVPGRAYLDGRADQTAQVVQAPLDIAVWNNSARERILCKLPHNTPVYVSTAKWVSEAHYYFFRVRSSTCEGWVPEASVGPKMLRLAGD